MITEEGWRLKVKHVYVHNDSDYNLKCVFTWLPLPCWNVLRSDWLDQ